MKEEKTQFYTARGYELLDKDSSQLTPSMEDYLEMTYRFTLDKPYTRISDLAAALNVQPPSVTSMIKKLAEMDWVTYEKYGLVVLTAKGCEMGAYLLERHSIIEEFLTLIGVKADMVLEQTEKIEHYLNCETVQSIKRLLQLFEQQPAWRQELQQVKD